MSFFDLSDYNIFTLKGFIKQSPPLSKEKLNDLYNRNKEYYFLALLEFNNFNKIILQFSFYINQ